MDWLEKMHFIHSWTGLFHTLTAILALIFGTTVWFNRKGTKKHKVLGYAYLISMAILNISAFGIYNFGSFSLFHAFALLSLFTIVMGMIPAFRRKNKKWIIKHFYFMNWSIVGLYCAFWAEIGVRLFDMRHFWWIVMLASIITSFIGAIMINREAKKINVN